MRVGEREEDKCEKEKKIDKREPDLPLIRKKGSLDVSNGFCVPFPLFFFLSFRTSQYYHGNFFFTRCDFYIVTLKGVGLYD